MEEVIDVGLLWASSHRTLEEQCHKLVTKHVYPWLNEKVQDQGDCTEMTRRNTHE
jgi:hypothetical protein